MKKLMEAEAEAEAVKKSMKAEAIKNRRFQTLWYLHAKNDQNRWDKGLWHCDVVVHWRCGTRTLWRFQNGVRNSLELIGEKKKKKKKISKKKKKKKKKKERKRK